MEQNNKLHEINSSPLVNVKYVELQTMKSYSYYFITEEKNG